MTDTPEAAIIRAYIEGNGYEVVVMSDGHNSAVPMDEKPVLEALDSMVHELDLLCGSTGRLRTQLGEAREQIDHPPGDVQDRRVHYRAGLAAGESVSASVIAALNAITPVEEPLDVDQDCKYCGAHFHVHRVDCEWVAACRALGRT